MNLRLVLFGLALVLVLALAADAWVRFAPLPADIWHRIPVETRTEAGDWPEAGGFEAVRQLPDPKARLVELDKIIRATPRTELLEGSPEEGLLTYVTRSAIWGFPDISTLWIEGDRIHLRGHLVFGRGDFGVNRARIEGWLARAGLVEQP